jgi:mono/diheme cytochrome c family protein
MKRLTNFLAIAVTVIIILLSSCSSDKRHPGKVYMPDMAYSRTFETYAELDSQLYTSNINEKGGLRIFFNEMPPAGTIKRGEMFPYTLPNDSTGYKLSAEIPNPLGPGLLNNADSAETARLFNINCAICHGAKGVANGPLSGKIGAIANLTLDLYKVMKDGTMFHSITYGKNNMGSYASQLNRKQRWQVIKYIRTLQGPATATVSDSTAKKPAVKDTAAIVKK